MKKQWQTGRRGFSEAGRRCHGRRIRGFAPGGERARPGGQLGTRVRAGFTGYAAFGFSSRMRHIGA